jgi:DNA-binding NarL/FixJ family response regulator
MNSPLSVLLVDDHRIFLEGLRRILDVQEFLTIVGEADTIEEAVAQAQRLQPDLTLLDLGLKDGNGLDAVPRLLEVSPRTRIIVLSGYGRENVLPALRRGACAFVSKDTASSHLLEAISAATRGELWTEQHSSAELVQMLLRQERERRPEDGLTPREKEVLRLVGAGKRNLEIARTLAISESTVKAHISSLMRKLGIDDRLQLTLHAARVTACAR